MNDLHLIHSLIKNEKIKNLKLLHYINVILYCKINKYLYAYAELN